MKPTHKILHARENGEKAYWTQIGVGWAHKSGQGMNLKFNYYPADEGDVVILKIDEKPEVAKEQHSEQAA